ncbi:MAG: FAD dependent oxidoreductase [Linnemannia gamsii]|nr:MAG: FAD dependent oxidoreductase [Linnemannia gamsii]
MSLPWTGLMTAGRGMRMMSQPFKTHSLTLAKRTLSSSVPTPSTNTRTDPRYLYGQSPSVAVMDFEYEVDHLVIGAGVVGLAIAERLAARGGGSTLLVEKNTATGQETSSRNSEVIHAGLYYPPNSLKTKLCIKGNEMMYDLCEKYNIEYQQITKWVVGQNESDLEYLETLSKKADKLLPRTKRMPGAPTFMLSEEEMRSQEPFVKGRAALVSPRTGIVDVHGLMQLLETRVQEHGGDLVLQCEVIYLEKLAGGGFKVVMKTSAGPVAIKAATVINSAGLHSDKVYNMLQWPVIPPTATISEITAEDDSSLKDADLADLDPTNFESRLPPLKQYYCKGHYYGYSGKALVSRLIYPVPDKNLTGLGTHLTLDLAGRMRFGPDVLYVNDPNDYSIDLSTVGSTSSMKTVSQVIQTYLPAIKSSSLYADYAGIRPKLAGPGEPFRDFIIHHHNGFVNLAGIESPGLTSSLAIAEHVETLLY